MKRKIIIRAPMLSCSGYGEHSRFLLRALRTREDLFDIYIVPITWGKTGWLMDDDDERRYIDKLIEKTALYNEKKGTYDISAQVTIPNEWQKLAPINIGVTAGLTRKPVNAVKAE